MGKKAVGLCLTLALALGGCLPGYLSNKHAGEESYLAPPITALDADGQTIRLKDHKDKVVLLSFWHSHCPPCRALFPRERELVRKFAGRPFVLLGVNADESPFELKQTQVKAGLTWPSFWDGMGGQISANYSVDRFPTFFLIDSEGVVRWRHVGAPDEGELERRIEELLTPK